MKYSVYIKCLFASLFDIGHSAYSQLSKLEGIEIEEADDEEEGEFSSNLAMKKFKKNAAGNIHFLFFISYCILSKSDRFWAKN